AVELGRELPKLEALPLLSPELVRAHRQSVADRLGKIDPAAVVPIARLRAAWPLLVALVALALLSRLWPGGFQRGWASLTSAEPPPSTSSEPIVGDIEVRLDYPAYTELPARVIPGSSGHVLALPGPRVTLAAR